MRVKSLSRALSLFLALALCLALLPVTGASAATGEWKMQSYGGTTDIVIPDGALVSAADGVGFTADYSKIYGSASAPSGNVVIYYAGAEKYTDSVLEFTLNMLGEENNRFRFAVFPHFVNGQNCDGIAIDTPAVLQHSYRVNNGEGWPGITNLLGLSFQTGKDYQIRLVTLGNRITMYVDGQRLTETATQADLGVTTFGFRMWGPVEAKELKKLRISNLSFRAYVPSAVVGSRKVIPEADWGADDVSIPITLTAGDSVATVKNGAATLAAGTDYSVSGEVITLKKEYIAAQSGSFTLDIAFAGGAMGSFAVVKEQAPVLYTEDFSGTAENWVKQSGSGTAKLENGALRVTGDMLILDTASPLLSDGEVEFVLETLNDNGHFGLVFRAGNGAWQSIYNNESARYQYATGLWNYRNSTGTNRQVLEDGTPIFKRPAGVNYIIKARFVGKTLTLWMDGNPIYSADISEMALTEGRIGIQTASDTDLLLKRVTYRSYSALSESVSAGTKTLAKDSLTVTLAADFPRVISYGLGGKSLDGCVVPKHYVSVNGTDYPATAVVTAESGESITYRVTVPGAGVSFDAVFTALAQNILDLRIQNIDEGTGTVYTLGFPDQPLLSAKKSQTGAAFNAAVHGGDVNLTLSSQAASKTANSYATIAIVTAGGLSASLRNNVLSNYKELTYRSFDLDDGGVTTGVWNTDFYYRGLDGQRMLPTEDPSSQVIVTEDTNGDGVLDWQDGANALKLLIGNSIPGADTVRDSMIHVGYNFASQAQQPFLKIADNMKRLSNLMDGFEQILVFKGYGNEGHDSGHADFADINTRAGGAEDLNTLTDAIQGIGTFGIHINHSEAYPEAKMFTSDVMTTKNGWSWLDQSKYIRREVDILNGGMKSRLDDLFAQAPDIGFVYVDTYRDDRFAAAKLAQSLTGDHGVILGTEEGSKLDRFTAWVHWTANMGNIHRFVYHTQKDVYGGSDLFWGGYNRSASMMSWQHNNNINTMLEQFYTNQLPQKYLMNHEVRRQTGSAAYFEGNVVSETGKKIYKDGKLIADGAGKIFIPWFAEDSVTRNPDEAAKIYHWNSSGGSTTWTLPAAWAGQTTVKLFKTTQTGKVLVDTLSVTDGQVTISAAANTPYVLYKGDETVAPDLTDWSVGSPIRDTSFNSRDFSIWQAASLDGNTSHIKFTDDGNGVSILTIEGAAFGEVSQTMTGLTPGQKYRVSVWAGADKGKIARLVVETPDGKSYSNHTVQTPMAVNNVDVYARGKYVQRIWVDFIQPDNETTAKLFLSADASGADGKASFMETRIVKTDAPALPKSFAAFEDFEHVDQGFGIFAPESYEEYSHLSETNLPYTTDTISGNWSLKYRSIMRTTPATMFLIPGVEYTMEFDALGAGRVYVQSESDGNNRVLDQVFVAGHSKFTFTVGAKEDYIVRIQNGSVMDNFQVYNYEDDTPPTTPENLTARVENNARVVLNWEAATDPDTPVVAYKVYRDGTLLATLGAVTTYTDSAVREYTAYSYTVSAINAGITEGAPSESVIAYVGTDLTAPTVLRAILNGMNSVTLTFNETLDKASAETVANYRLTGTSDSVTNAVLQADGVTVVLTLSGQRALYAVTLQVFNVKDLAGNKTLGDQAFTLSTLRSYYKFDEAAGAPAYDFMGREDGVKASTVGTTTGVSGPAARFNGDGYVDLTANTLRGLSEYTISAWINWDGNTSESNTIFSNNTSGVGGDSGVWLRINAGGIITADNIVGGSVTSGSKGAAVGQWAHVALVSRSGGTDLYLNGELVGTGANKTIRAGDNRLRIGGNFNASNALLHKFRGSIDEFKVFSVALTAQDIANIAAVKETPPTVLGESFVVVLPEPKPLKVGVDFGGKTLSGVLVDGALLEDTAYTVSHNGVTFSAEYLGTLAVGTHTLTFNIGGAKSTAFLQVIMVQPPVDRTALMEAIYYARRLNADDYPASRWTKLQAALNLAVSISERETLSAQEVSDAAMALRDAIDKLTAPSLATLKLQLAPNLTMKRGTSLNLRAAVITAPDDAWVELAFASSNSSVVSVNADGVLTGLRTGTAVVTVKDLISGATVAVIVTVS